MDGIWVERIRREDIPQLAGLYAELSDADAGPGPMFPVFERIDANPEYVLIGAKQGDRLLGSAMGVVCQQLCRHCRPFMVIENVVVGGSFRRMGVGALLMREMERIAVERNCHRILFVSSMKRKAAHAFYASIGYSLDEVQGFRKNLP